MWVDHVEWMEDQAHFSMGIDRDTLEEIMNKGSLEDDHKDVIMEALTKAWNRV